MTATESDLPNRYQLGGGAALKRAVTEAHKLLDDLVANDMASLGLTIGEADVLTVVHVSDHAPVPSEIADWLSLTGAGATGRLNTLERRGLLERLPNPTDGRSVTIHLTSEGARLAAAVIDAKDSAVMTSLVSRIGPDLAATLTQNLDLLSTTAREFLANH